MIKFCVYVFVFSLMFVSSIYAKDPIIRKLDKYPIKAKSLEKKDSFGGNVARAGYRYGYDVSHAKLDGVPYAMYIGAEAAVTAGVYKINFDFMKAQSYLVANALTDGNKKAEFVSDVKILFFTLWEIPGIEVEVGTRKEYWNSKDRWGKEKYRVYKNKGISFPIPNPFVPLTASFNLGGTLGLTGSLYQYSSRYPDLRFEYGPYAALSTTISGEVNLGIIKGGVYGTLGLIDLNVKAFSNVRLDVSPETQFPSAYFKASIPMELKGGSGSLGLFLKAYRPYIHWHKRWRFKYPTVHFRWHDYANLRIAKFDSVYKQSWDLWKEEKWYYKN